MLVPSFLAQQPVDDYGFVFSPLKYTAMLAANVDTTLVVPGDAPRYKVIINSIPGASWVWMALNEPAANPAGATILPSSSEMVHVTASCREVKAGDVLHFLSPNANTPLSIVLYALYTPT